LARVLAQRGAIAKRLAVGQSWDATLPPVGQSQERDQCTVETLEIGVIELA